MIKPHGSEVLKPLYVADESVRQELCKEANSLPSIIINSAAAL
jgi:sulfate adenylyltransferase